MTSNDWKRLLLGPTLFRLDTVISPPLVPILYAVGLLAILVWAINHLFLMFAGGPANGFWGLVEIVVFGLLAVVVLRIACEVLLVFFKSHEAETESVSRGRAATTLLEEVKDAIHDLAEADEDGITISEPVHVAPTPAAPPPRPAAADPAMATAPVKRTPARRTAKRSPAPKPAPETKL